jgi:hypothetical protein
MSADAWIILGFVVVIGLPLVVLVVVILWPDRVPKDRTVERSARIEDEEGPPSTR